LPAIVDGTGFFRYNRNDRHVATINDEQQLPRRNHQQQQPPRHNHNYQKGSDDG
jgi:hypothetical protein